MQIFGDVFIIIFWKLLDFYVKLYNNSSRNKNTKINNIVYEEIDTFGFCCHFDDNSCEGSVCPQSWSLIQQKWDIRLCANGPIL